MGKTEEALSVCLSAKELLYKNDSLLMDDLTLSTLQIVFQRLEHRQYIFHSWCVHKWCVCVCVHFLTLNFYFPLPVDLATSCYEYACGKFTNNLELMMGLFNCYVREYSFVKQQQVRWYMITYFIITINFPGWSRHYYMLFVQDIGWIFIFFLIRRLILLIMCSFLADSY